MACVDGKCFAHFDVSSKKSRAHLNVSWNVYLRSILTLTLLDRISLSVIKPPISIIQLNLKHHRLWFRLFIVLFVLVEAFFILSPSCDSLRVLSSRKLCVELRQLRQFSCSADIAHWGSNFLYYNVFRLAKCLL